MFIGWNEREKGWLEGGGGTHTVGGIIFITNLVQQVESEEYSAAVVARVATKFAYSP